MSKRVGPPPHPTSAWPNFMSLGHWDSVALMNLIEVMWYSLAILLLRKASFARSCIVVSCLVRTMSSIPLEGVLDVVEDELVVEVVDVVEDVVVDEEVLEVVGVVDEELWVEEVWDVVWLAELLGDGLLLEVLAPPPPPRQPAATTLKSRTKSKSTAALFFMVPTSLQSEAPVFKVLLHPGGDAVKSPATVLQGHA